jgi:hypothetical protein
MKKINTLIPLIFMAFVSTSALAGTCTINLVKEDGNFAPIDYGPGGMVTYDVTIPFTDGYYPNPWTSSQPKPRVSLSNCITYAGAPSNATIKSVSYNYTFHEAVLVADYQIMVAYFGPQNKFEFPFIRGGGNPRFSGIPLNGTKVSTIAAGQLLSAVDIELRARVTNREANADCPAYIRRDQCRTKNTRLTNFTATITW